MPYCAKQVLDGAAKEIMGCDMYIATSGMVKSEDEAKNLKLGEASPKITGPSSGPSGGSKVVIEPILDGSITEEGRATHWALLKNGKVMYCDAFVAPQVFYKGNIFITEKVQIDFPGFAND